MLRNNMPKQPTKQPEPNKQSQIKHSNTTKTVLPPSVPSITKVESRPLILEKQKFDKAKILEMVAKNKIKQAKKQNEIVNKISYQMMSKQRRKFKEYAGELKNALKLSQRPEQRSIKLESFFKPYRSQQFKAQQYI